MAQMWAGHCSLLMGAAAHLKDEAVSHRLRQAGFCAIATSLASVTTLINFCVDSSWPVAQE